MNAREEFAGRRVEAAPVHPPEPVHPIGPLDLVGVEVKLPRTELRHPLGQVQLALPFLQGLLGDLEVGDVEEGPVDADNCTGIVP